MDDAAAFYLGDVWLSAFFLTMAVRPPFDNRTYLMEFRTFAYARDAKFGRTEHFLWT